MNNAIIGTAGHVDHGKTLLIKALTGMDTDRLAEEKKRGITIELGFAYLDLPNGQKAGIIDVPGHEKFVRNMLAGAGSIDLCLLVIAADEGIMPQTREHLAILNTLGIRRGLVALNKIDLVDSDWLDMVTLDIEDELAGGFLDGTSIIPVSAHTGEGVDVLREAIKKMLEHSTAKRPDLPFRLPIDRVFTSDGFGTVVTGTLIEGTLGVGDEVVVFPSMLTAKIRRMHVHGTETDRAAAGQRVAVNLAGLKISDINKGDCVAAAGSMVNSRVMDVVIEIHKDTSREIKNNSRLHLHHGTRDLLCTLTLLDTQSLAAGERAYGQLRLAEPLAAKPGDKFVLRFYSPTETIGGGAILDADAKRVKRQDAEALKRLAIKDSGSLRDKIEVVFAEKSADLPTKERIKQLYFAADDGFDACFDELLEIGRLADLGAGMFHVEHLNEIGVKAQGVLDKYHKENPLHRGMSVKVLCRVLPHLPQNIAERALGLLAARGLFSMADGLAALAGFKAAASDTHKKIRGRLLDMFLEAGIAVPSFDEVAKEFGKDKKAFEQMFETLVQGGELIMLSPQIFMHWEFYAKAVEIFVKLAGGGAEVGLGDYRDALGASRKYALALLEYFDKKGITKKAGEGRVLK